MKLCTCNQCGNIYQDMNPQTGAKDYPDDLPFEPLALLSEPSTVEDKEFYWGCPKCQTDGFLSDNIVPRNSTIVLNPEDSITIAANKIRIVVKYNDIGVSVDYYSEDGDEPFREEQCLFDDAD